jgi:threonylcarbamoyladenosine tRNA methylthiotransferase MtaB
MMSEESTEVVTFGCRLNAYESEVMRAHAKNADMQDAIIFNTCAVTKEAERQARQAIRKARRNNPDKKIIVTGCSAQINPEMYKEMSEVDHIIGNDLKLIEKTWSKPFEEKVIVNDIMAVKETAGHLIEGLEGKTRAFLQVQNGCDHRCTFCIIPYGRGNSRSVPIGEIVRQIKALVQNGCKEVVITGVDITSYGHDLPGDPSLGQMLKRVLALVPELPRLRLSSIDPVEIDEDLWRLLEDDKRFMPHLHLSLQAGDDMVLKRMKRRHLRDDVIKVCDRARKIRPDIVFGADIIAGFPTETEEMFENTLALVKECDFTYLHVFPYSERPGTPAAKMPQVEKKVRAQRAAKLRELGKKQEESLLKSKINKTIEVLVEKENYGHSNTFMPVRFDKDMMPGDIVKFKALKIEEGSLVGKVM